jgi:hypothetical protein
VLALGLVEGPSIAEPILDEIYSSHEYATFACPCENDSWLHPLKEFVVSSGWWAESRTLSRVNLDFCVVAVAVSTYTIFTVLVGQVGCCQDTLSSQQVSFVGASFDAWVLYRWKVTAVKARYHKLW